MAKIQFQEFAHELHYNLPSTVIIGGGARHQLGAQLQRLSARRALVVTDPFLVANGTAAAITEGLSKAGIETEIFAKVQPDPTVANVIDGLAALTRRGKRSSTCIGLLGKLESGGKGAFMRKHRQPIRVPLEYCGKWIAWNHDRTRIIASGTTYGAVRKAAEATGERRAYLTKAPEADTRFVGGRS